MSEELLTKWVKSRYEFLKDRGIVSGAASSIGEMADKISDALEHYNTIINSPNDGLEEKIAELEHKIEYLNRENDSLNEELDRLERMKY